MSRGVREQEEKDGCGEEKQERRGAETEEKEVGVVKAMSLGSKWMGKAGRLQKLRKLRYSIRLR